MTPSVCLTMLVRDESAVITRALDSVGETVPDFDSFCIVDTGSTDDTREKIAAWMSAHGKFGVIHQRRWVNFGHNRTEAVELAAKRGETFALLLDADQTFVGRLEIDDSQGIARYDAVNTRGSSEYAAAESLRRLLDGEAPDDVREAARENLERMWEG